MVQLDDGRLIAYCRRGGDYDPKTIGYIVRSESRDGGLTWSEGKDSAFPNPNAAVDFLKLQSGRLLLIFNDSMNRRTPLTAALSSDQDRTWPIRRNIREGDGDFGYPTAFQARDGRIHLVFTSEGERSSITRSSMKTGLFMAGDPTGNHQFDEGEPPEIQCPRNHSVRVVVETSVRTWCLLLELRSLARRRSFAPSNYY